jgi:hypothetical protein
MTSGYTNPLDCLREYAQNGVDAGASTITIAALLALSPTLDALYQDAVAESFTAAELKIRA